MEDCITIASRFGRVLAVITGVVLIGGLVAIVVDSGLIGLVRYCWPLVFIGFAAWALFWQPRLMVTNGGVTLHNVLRTVYVPWALLNDVETRYALTLITDSGSYAAWAAPAPTRYAARSITKADVERFSPTGSRQGLVRPGDIPTTESGQAAQVILSRWESHRETHGLATVLIAHRIVTRWHWVTIATFVVLGSAAGLSVAR